MRLQHTFGTISRLNNTSETLDLWQQPFSFAARVLHGRNVRKPTAIDGRRVKHLKVRSWHKQGSGQSASLRFAPRVPDRAVRLLISQTRRPNWATKRIRRLERRIPVESAHYNCVLGSSRRVPSNAPEAAAILLFMSNFGPPCDGRSYLRTSPAILGWISLVLRDVPQRSRAVAAARDKAR